MQNKIVKITGKILLFTIKTVGKALLLTIFLLMRLLSIMSRYAEAGLRYACLKAELIDVEAKEQPNAMEATFTEAELEAMAKDVSKEMTLSDIQNRHRISYRQARKVRDIAEKSIEINRYNPMNIHKIYV